MERYEPPGRTRIVQGCLGPMEVLVMYSEEEARMAWDSGAGVPLDQMPDSFWWVGEGHNALLRHGEEILGSDF